jgi:hypothetical protein
LAKILDIENFIRKVGPIYSVQLGVQVDLAFERTDNVFSLIEIKYYDKPVEISIVKEFSDRLQKLQLDKKFSIEKILISPFGATKSVIDSHFFDYVVDAQDIFK